MPVVLVLILSYGLLPRVVDKVLLLLPDLQPVCRLAVEEQVHEPGLAAPDTAPQVQAAQRRAAARAQERGEPARCGRCGLDEAGAQRIEVRDGLKLRRVGAEAALAQLCLVAASQLCACGGGNSR